MRWCSHVVLPLLTRRTASVCVRAQAQVRCVKIRVAAGRVDRDRGEAVQPQGQRALHGLLRRSRRSRRRICALHIDPRSVALMSAFCDYVAHHRYGGVTRECTLTGGMLEGAREWRQVRHVHVVCVSMCEFVRGGADELSAAVHPACEY